MNLVNTPFFLAGELKVAMVLKTSLIFRYFDAPFYGYWINFSTSNYQVPWKWTIFFPEKGTGPFLLIKRMFYLPTINFQEIWLLFKGMKAWIELPKSPCRTKRPKSASACKAETPVVSASFFGKSKGPSGMKTNFLGIRNETKFETKQKNPCRRWLHAWQQFCKSDLF